MNLSLSTVNSIRPLGEEHLKMFRRMVQGNTDAIPKVNLPTEKVSLSIICHISEKATYKKARATARKAGGRLATLMEVVQGAVLLGWAQGESCFIDWKDAPTKPGWYYVNRKSRTLLPILRGPDKLKWDERLLVRQSALEMIKKRRPLKLGIGYPNIEMLELDGDYSSDERLSVAVAKVIE